MTELETAIVATLRAEAEGAAMTTDTTHEHDILENRLDHVDQRRRRVTWLGAVAAAVTIVLVVVGARAFTSSRTPEPVAPSPSASAPRHVTTAFRPTVSMVLPPWVATGKAVISRETDREAIWSVCDGDCGKAPASVLGVVAIASVLDPSAPTGFSTVTKPEQLLASLDRAAAAGSLAILERTTTTVDGFPATVMSLDELRSVPNGFGCELVNGQACFDLLADWDRIAVIDYGGATVVVVASMPRTAPSATKADIASQFDQMLTTLSLSTPRRLTSS